MAEAEHTREQVLSRVRDEIWKMRGSEEVENVLKSMWHGLRALGVPLMYCSVNLVDEEADPPLVVVYSLNQEGSWRRREFRVDANAPLLRLWHERRTAYRPDLRREDPYGEVETFDNIAVCCVLDVPFEQGTLAISSKTPDAFSPEDIGVLQEMARLIDDGFRRLQDLRDLERRNRELEREIAEREELQRQQAALHLVRQQVWEMKGENDIERVMDAVEDSLAMLGVPFREYGINILDQDSDPPAVRTNTKVRGHQARVWNEIATPVMLDFINNLQRTGEILYRRDLQVEDLYDVLEARQGDFDDAPIRSIVDVPFSRGSLAVNSPEPEAFSERHLAFLRQLAGVLSEGFYRLEDLRKLEDRNRELEREIVKRKEAETDSHRAREEAEAANRAKSAFLANMSHELRTPLNAILGFTQLMSRDATLSAGQRENLDIVGRSGEHLLNLINDVLEMSRIEAGRTELHLEAFDLYHMLDNLEAMFRLRTEDRGLELTCERAADLPRYVRTDQSKLRQILINLVGNAIKFTEKGAVTLRVEAGEGEKCAQLFFAVEDTGPGIAPEELERLFDAFVQTAAGRQFREGTGLGLPISRQFAQLMGGEIAVRSRVGEGSVFTFDIQIDPAEADSVSEIRPARQVTGLEPGQPTYRILVVEDQVENRRLLVKLLEPIGFALREATDGREAIAIWETWHPHLIWMDIRMPVMDGLEATQHIKATPQGRDTVVIALTASAFEENREVVLEAGCDDFMRKPFHKEELFEVMARYLDLRYQYAEEAAPSPSSSKNPLEPGDLMGLPPAWKTKLHRAASTADDEAIRKLLAQIEVDHAAISAALAELERDFRFDEIMELTQNATEDTHA